MKNGNLIKTVQILVMIWLISGCNGIQPSGPLNPSCDDVSNQIAIQMSVEPRLFHKNPLMAKPSMGVEIENQKISAYINGIMEKLCAQLQIPNVPVILTGHGGYSAYVGPDQAIRISAGLIQKADSEDEIAAVLAHELSHVYLGHTKRIQFNNGINGITNLCQITATDFDNMISKDLNSGMISNKLAYASSITDFITGPVWSREQEDQADLNALKLLEGADYSLRGMMIVMEKITSQGVTDKKSWHAAMAERFSTSIATAMETSVKNAGDEAADLINGEGDAKNTFEHWLTQSKQLFTKALEDSMTDSVYDISDRFSSWSSRFHREALNRQTFIKSEIKERYKQASIQKKKIKRKSLQKKSLRRLKADQQVASLLRGLEQVEEARKLAVYNKKRPALQNALRAMNTEAGNTAYALSVLCLIDQKQFEERQCRISRLKHMPPVLYDMAVQRHTRKGEMALAEKMALRGKEEYGALFYAPVKVYWANLDKADKPRELKSSLVKCKYLNHQSTYSACLSAAEIKTDDGVAHVDLGEKGESGLLDKVEELMKKISD